MWQRPALAERGSGLFSSNCNLLIEILLEYLLLESNMEIERNLKLFPRISVFAEIMNQF